MVSPEVRVSITLAKQRGVDVGDERNNEWRGKGEGAEQQELCWKQLRENEAFRMTLDINY